MTRNKKMVVALGLCVMMGMSGLNAMFKSDKSKFSNPSPVPRAGSQRSLVVPTAPPLHTDDGNRNLPAPDYTIVKGGEKQLNRTLSSGTLDRVQATYAATGAPVRFADSDGVDAVYVPAARTHATPKPSAPPAEGHDLFQPEVHPAGKPVVGRSQRNAASTRRALSNEADENDGDDVNDLVVPLSAVPGASLKRGASVKNAAVKRGAAAHIGDDVDDAAGLRGGDDVPNIPRLAQKKLRKKVSASKIGVLPQDEAAGVPSPGSVALKRTAVETTLRKFDQTQLNNLKKALQEYKKTPSPRALRVEQRGDMQIQMQAEGQNPLIAARKEVASVNSALSYHIAQQKAAICSHIAQPVTDLFIDQRRSWKRLGISSYEQLMRRATSLIDKLADPRPKGSFMERTNQWISKQFAPMGAMKGATKIFCIVGVVTLALVAIKAVGIFTGGIGLAVPALCVGIWAGLRWYRDRKLKAALLPMLTKNGLLAAINLDKRDFGAIFDAVAKAYQHRETENEAANMNKLFSLMETLPVLQKN